MRVVGETRNGGVSSLGKRVGTQESSGNGSVTRKKATSGSSF